MSAMKSARTLLAPVPRFGLAFGSLVFVRALLDRGSASPAVTFVMFLFFAGVSGAAYAGASVPLRRRPLLTAAITALALLLFITLPSLLSAPLTMLISARTGVRIFFAWLYVCALFAGLSTMAGMKIKILAVLALTPLAMYGHWPDPMTSRATPALLRKP